MPCLFFFGLCGTDSPLYGIMLSYMGGYPSTTFLDNIELKAFPPIDNPVFISSLAISLRLKVRSLSLFYSHYFGRCSLELTNCVLPPLMRPCNNRQASFTHRYNLTVAYSRMNGFVECFLPFTCNLWNSLLDSVSPDSFNLSTFRR